MTALNYVVAFAVLLSVLIFVHELGHFLVAKACGVRVLKFCLGFGPPVRIGPLRLAWKRGHTEYAIAWFPLGGFVKMLGESPDEEDDPETRAHPDEALNAKPLWQKLAIVFAGPAMNLALPVVIFMGTLSVGMPRPAAVVGSVEMGSPAERAGIEPGDRIVAVAGQPVAWWDEVTEAIRKRPGAELEVAVERAGERRPLQLALDQRGGLDEFDIAQTVGWAGLSHGRLPAILGVPDAGSPAHLAGLRSGDRILSVAGEPVEDWYAFGRAYAAVAPGGQVALEVKRPSEDAAEELELEVPALGDLAALGAVPATVLIAAVEPGLAAERAGMRPGDLVLSIDAVPVGSFLSFREAVRASGGRELSISFARAGTPHVVSIRPERRELESGLGIREEQFVIGVTPVDAALPLPGVAGVDRERNPLLSLPRAVGMTVDFTGTFLRGLGKILTGQVSRKQVAGPLGIMEIAGKAWQLGWEFYLQTLVLISINLGILNLLPIPILDGGQALLFLVEGVKRSPLSLRTRLAVQQIGLTVLALLMGMAFWNDISRQWSKVLDWLRSGAL